MQEPWHRRHDISDNVWERLEPFLLGRKGTWGGNARDNRQFINESFHRKIHAILSNLYLFCC